MKAVLAFVVFVAVVALSSAVYSHTDGKPVCTQLNVATSKFRNNFDPTQYWLCSATGKDSDAVVCPSETGFVDSIKDCVSWDQWVWEEPYDPPTD